MKSLLLTCSILLLVGIFNLPIGYYTLLRIVVTIGAIAVIVSELKGKPTPWIFAFGLIAVTFNPIIPVYLYDKEVWQVIDLVSAALFIIKTLKI